MSVHCIIQPWKPCASCQRIFQTKYSINPHRKIRWYMLFTIFNLNKRFYFSSLHFNWRNIFRNFHNSCRLLNVLRLQLLLQLRYFKKKILLLFYDFLLALFLKAKLWYEALHAINNNAWCRILVANMKTDFWFFFLFSCCINETLLEIRIPKFGDPTPSLDRSVVLAAANGKQAKMKEFT